MNQSEMPGISSQSCSDSAVTTATISEPDNSLILPTGSADQILTTDMSSSITWIDNPEDLILNFGTPGVIGTVGPANPPYYYTTTIADSSWIKFTPTYTIQMGEDDRRYLTESEIVEMQRNKEEIENLCNEIPAVKEAWERLQTLVKLYRE